MTHEYEEFEVEVQRTISATVKVRARNEAAAAKAVDNVSFPLPPEDAWDVLSGYLYIVRDSKGEQLYEGDGQGLE